jgi:hypothetical protein
MRTTTQSPRTNTQSARNLHAQTPELYTPGHRAAQTRHLPPQTYNLLCESQPHAIDRFIKYILNTRKPRTKSVDVSEAALTGDPYVMPKLGEETDTTKSAADETRNLPSEAKEAAPKVMRLFVQLEYQRLRMSILSQGRKIVDPLNLNGRN